MQLFFLWPLEGGKLSFQVCPIEASYSSLERFFCRGSKVVIEVILKNQWLGLYRA